MATVDDTPSMAGAGAGPMSAGTAPAGAAMVTATASSPGSAAWFALDTDAVVAAVGSDLARGLTSGDAANRLSRYGANEIAKEKPPSVWEVALNQVRDPMNIMLIAVIVVSCFISQFSTAVLVLFLVLLNVVLGSRQELKARASVDALSKMQVPQAKVVRDGELGLVPAVDLVPGDVVQLEAGDIVPADGRIVRAATLETQEAALTGESAPVSKDAETLPAGDVALGDRSNMAFQNTSVTRGTATVVVTATGMQTQMGQIATMLSSVTRTRSPLQKELDSLTKVLAIIAWSAVAFIFVVGLARGEPAKQLLLLGTAMAIAAIPTGLPAFVSGLLSMGAKQLAEAKAVVKNLTDVETLGATSAINTDKTGTLTMNEMMVSDPLRQRLWFTVEGEGYAKTGAIRAVAGAPVPDFTRLALGLCLDSDATVRPRGTSLVTPRRRPSSCWRPSSASTARRPGGRTPGWPRCPSTRSTSSWPRSTGYPGRHRRRWWSWSRVRPTSSWTAAAGREGPCSGSEFPIARAGRARSRQRADGGAGPAGAGLRRPRRERRRDLAVMALDPMALTPGWPRRHGGDHRPVAGRGQRRGADRARRRASTCA